MKLVAAVLMLLTLGALGEVVKDFKDCKKQFFHKGDPPEFENSLTDARYVRICQKYKNEYRYATLYDTKNKIPVYSAYKYERKEDCKVKRPDITWMIEPQIGNKDAGKEMTLQNKMPKSDLQAYNSYYEGSRYDKGHLYPHCHAPDEETSESTFTLTNAAPQRCDFNNFWNDKVEEKVKKDLKDTCMKDEKTPYMVTGVVPSTEKEYLTLKNSKVNVPTHFWTAYCCCDNNNKNCHFGGFIMQKEADEPEVFTTSKNLNEKLSDLYNKKPFTVFSSC